MIDVEEYMGLANTIAWKYQYINHLDLEETRAMCYEYLVMAAHKFDSSKGVPFGTFAGTFIMRRLQDFRVRELRQRILTIPFNYHMTDDNGLDEESGEDRYYASGEDVEHDVVQPLAIQQMLKSKHLKPRQREILTLIISNPDIDQRQIAKILGISFQRVSQILKEIKPAFKREAREILVS